jgi:hypothetical protein
MIDYQAIGAIIEAALKEDDEKAGRFGSEGWTAHEGFELWRQQRLAIDECKRDIVTAVMIFLVCPTLTMVAYLLPNELAWFKTGMLASAAILVFVALVVLMVRLAQWRKLETPLLVNR